MGYRLVNTNNMGFRYRLKAVHLAFSLLILVAHASCLIVDARFENFELEETSGYFSSSPDITNTRYYL